MLMHYVLAIGSALLLSSLNLHRGAGGLRRGLRILTQAPHALRRCVARRSESWWMWARALRSLPLVRRVRGADVGRRQGHPLQIALS
jgi:hypothetical protein